LLIWISFKGAGQGVHQFDHEGFIVGVVNPSITFITATEPNDAAASTVDLGQTLALPPSFRRLVSHRLQPSIVAAEYGSPPEVAAGKPAPGSAFMILARPLAAP
jgi:hypothetical protein